MSDVVIVKETNTVIVTQNTNTVTLAQNQNAITVNVGSVGAKGDKGDKGDAGVGGVPGGADTQIQFNDGGEFNGSNEFTYNKVTGSVHVGAGIEELSNNPLAMSADIDDYLQTNIRNRSAGVYASSDYVATADNGTDSTHYVDFGVNSSLYNSEDFEAFKANDGYVISEGGDLDLCSTKYRIKFVIGGTADADVMGEINTTGLELVAGSDITIDGDSIQPDWNASTGMATILNKPSTFAPASHDNTAHSTAYATDSDMSNAEGAISALQQSQIDIWSTGQVSGGQMTINADPTKVNIASGKGYIHEGLTYHSVSWDAFIGVDHLYTGNNYVSINADGELIITATAQDPKVYIVLGIFFWNSGLSQVRLVFNLPERVGEYANVNNIFIREAIGALISSGFSVSESATPLRLTIGTGKMYVNLSAFDITSQTTTFIKLHNTADNGITPIFTNANYVDVLQWNDVTQNNGSALITMTDSYWKKDLLVIGVNGSAYYAYGTAEYATEDLAKAGALPSFAETLRADNNVFLVTIVTQKGDTSIANRLYDVRPLFSRIFGTELSASGGSVIDHGALTGLGDDDHSQYHNDSRADTWLSGKDLDDIADSATYAKLTVTEQTKLSGIETGAEVNVQADWNAVSGDSFIQNKPTIPTQYTDELAQDATGNMATGSLVYTDLTPALQLSGDATTPGNSKYYGTNSGGTKGFYDLPAGGGGTDNIGVVIDGGGSAISTGSKGFREIPFDCTITGWTILGKESGSCVVDIKRSTYSGFPSTASIAGSEKPTLSSAQKNQDLSLTTWTTAITAGDIIEFVVDSAATVTRVMLSIRVTK